MDGILKKAPTMDGSVGLSVVGAEIVCSKRPAIERRAGGESGLVSDLLRCRPQYFFNVRVAANVCGEHVCVVATKISGFITWL